MPYLTQMIDGGTGVIRTGRGVVTGREILQAVSAWESEGSALEQITHALIDLTDAASMEISAEEMRRIVEVDKRNANRMPHVFVAIAAPRDIAYGLSRMYLGMTSSTGWTVTILRTRDEALEWLASIVPGTERRSLLALTQEPAARQPGSQACNEP